MTHTIAVIIQKGGTGKTTLTINLGAALAQWGKRVLLVDLDPQGHLTEGVGLQDCYLNEERTLYKVLIGKNGIAVQDLIRKSPHEQLFIIPASYEMELAEQSLYLARNREHKLKAVLAQLEGKFDFILIDCPPALGNLTDNALNAARQVVIPIQAEATSVRSLELLFDQIESIERGLNIHITVLAVVPNMVQDSAMSKRILDGLRKNVPTVTPFELRKRVMLQNAWEQGRSIFAFQTPATADERTRREIVDTYQDLASFVVDNIDTHKGEQGRG